MSDTRLEPLELSEDERRTLENWAKRRKTAQGLALRARGAQVALGPSADGFIEGPERELNLHQVDDESDQVRRVFGPAGAGLKTLVWPRAARV